MPAIYEDHGIRFAYPENWKLVEPDIETGLVDITLHSPGGSIWSVQLVPEGFSPAECIEQVIEGLAEEYEDLEKESKSLELGSALLTGYELRFFCLDMLVEACVWACRLPGKTVVCQYQAEQREYATLEPVFQAITTSLFQEDFGN